MKKITLLIFLCFYCCTSAQSIQGTLNIQKESLEMAEQALKKRDELRALSYYYLCSSDLNTEFDAIAKKKIDSLFPIVQKKEAEKWKKKCKGKWKLKQLKTDQFSYQYIVITDSEILFYDKSIKATPSRTEKIRFLAYDMMPENPTEFITNVIFGNNEIWEFTVEKGKQETRLFPKLKLDSNGTYYMLIDDRGIIRDPIRRKKALAEETRTFYTRL